jgi:hypothetical protein
MALAVLKVSVPGPQKGCLSRCRDTRDVFSMPPFILKCADEPHGLSHQEKINLR